MCYYFLCKALALPACTSVQESFDILCMEMTIDHLTHLTQTEHQLFTLKLTSQAVLCSNFAEKEKKINYLNILFKCLM